MTESIQNSETSNDKYAWKSDKYFLTSLGLFLVVFYIYNIPFDEAYARGHDYLQSIYSLYFTRAEIGGFFFNFELSVPQIIDGLPFNALALSDFGFGQNLYLILTPFEAHVANEFIRRMLALVGLYLLIRDYILPRSDYGCFIAAAVAFSFAVLPDQPNRFGTVAMQPLLYWAFLNIWNSDYKIRNFLIVLIYPFYSMLVLGGFVICGYFLLAAILAFVLNRKNKHIILYIFLFTVCSYLFIEMRMFYHWFVSDYISMRHTQIPGTPTFAAFAEQFIGIIFKANHANHITEHSPAILFVTFLGFISVVVSKFAKAPKENSDPTAESAIQTHKLFLFLLFVVFINTIIYSLDNSSFLDFKYDIGLPFGFHRVDVSSPVIWRLLLALSVYILAMRLAPRRRWITSTIVVIIAAHSLLQMPGVKGGIRNALDIPEHVGLRAYITGSKVKPELRYHPDQTALKVYFQTDTFPLIEALIRKRSGLEQSAYRTVSIDLVPSLARYHGYYSLDAWLYDAPASYAEKFFRLSASEYAKDGVSPPINEGLVSLEMYVSNKSRKAEEINLGFDTCAFMDLGGKVIFSRYGIIDPERIGFDFMGQFGTVHAYLLQNDWKCG